MREWIELTDFGRYGLVWQKTLATYREWMAAEGWDKKDVIDVPRVQQYTFKVLPACSVSGPSLSPASVITARSTGHRGLRIWRPILVG